MSTPKPVNFQGQPPPSRERTFASIALASIALAEMTFDLPNEHPLAQYIQLCRTHQELPFVSRRIRSIAQTLQVRAAAVQHTTAACCCCTTYYSCLLLLYNILQLLAAAVQHTAAACDAQPCINAQVLLLLLLLLLLPTVILMSRSVSALALALALQGDA
jgi:hypothetical protein